MFKGRRCAHTNSDRSPPETNATAAARGPQPSAAPPVPFPGQLPGPHLGGQAVPEHPCRPGQEVSPSQGQDGDAEPRRAQESRRQPRGGWRGAADTAADRQRHGRPREAPGHVTAARRLPPGPAHARRTHAHCARHEGRCSDQVTRRRGGLPAPLPASRPFLLVGGGCVDERLCGETRGCQAVAPPGVARGRPCARAPPRRPGSASRVVGPQPRSRPGGVKTQSWVSCRSAGCTTLTRLGVAFLESVPGPDA